MGCNPGHWCATHTLVPGFVVDTRLEPGARVVAFGNGMVVREPIVDIDDRGRRLGRRRRASDRHYNGSVQVFPEGQSQSRVVWVADFLPNEAADQIRAMIEQGMAVYEDHT